MRLLCVLLLVLPTTLSSCVCASVMSCQELETRPPGHWFFVNDKSDAGQFQIAYKKFLHGQI